MNRVHFMRDAQGEWRWHLKDEGNHKIVGAASEGFDSYRNAYNNAVENYGDRVEYVKWAHEDTDDVEVTLDVGQPTGTVQGQDVETSTDDGITPED